MWLSTSNESALFQHSLVALLKKFFLKSTHGHDHHQGHTFGCLTLRSKICVFLIPITNFYCLKMARPSYRSQSNVTRSIPPPCSIHGMRGSRKTSCDGLANKTTAKSVYTADECRVHYCNHRTLTYFERGSITVRLTSCLFCLDSATFLMLN